MTWGFKSLHPHHPRRGSSSVVEYHLAKVRVAGSNPVFRSKKNEYVAGVAEMADAQDLKSCGRLYYRAGSIPALGTISARSSIG